MMPSLTAMQYQSGLKKKKKKTWHYYSIYSTPFLKIHRHTETYTQTYTCMHILLGASFPCLYDKIHVFFNMFLFTYLFLAVLGLHCCAWAFSSCGERATLRCGAWVSHCSGFSCCGAQALGTRASVVVSHGL